ncbi:hypothetical protein [Oryza sativa Japonica Group]|uniref:Uncharacterized protein P0413G02.23 n=1 Tax=Oryza sativa subsp. japonica TaxID=39947 RepID=Q5ZAZ2_ORYSJ|nr:hypothetical protein [Oryza sativa Japonica Group]
MGWSLERNIPLRSVTRWSAEIGRTNPSHFDGQNGVNSRSLPLGSAAAPPRPLVPHPPAPSPSAAPSSSARLPPLIRDRRRLVRVRPPPPRPAAAAPLHLASPPGPAAARPRLASPPRPASARPRLASPPRPCPTSASATNRRRSSAFASSPRPPPLVHARRHLRDRRRSSATRLRLSSARANELLNLRRRAPSSPISPAAWKLAAGSRRP